MQIRKRFVRFGADAAIAVPFRRQNKVSKKLPRIAMLLSVTVSCALPHVEAQGLSSLEGQGKHPFAPYIITLNSLITAVLAPSFSCEIGDLFSGNADGIDQSTYGDCWFESSVGAVSRYPKGQEIISQMITRVGTGDFNVTFLDQPNRPVRVTTSEMTNLKLNDSALWGKIIEAAAIKRFPLLRQQGDHAFAAMYGLQENFQIGLRMMTGSQASALRTDSTSEAEIAKILSHNMQLQIPTVAGSHPASLMPNPLRPLVVQKHCFAVIGFNEGRGLVVLRNPWGKNYSPRFPYLPKPGQTIDDIQDIGGGVITMPLKQFRAYYESFGWAPMSGH